MVEQLNRDAMTSIRTASQLADGRLVGVTKMQERSGGEVCQPFGGITSQPSVTTGKNLQVSVSHFEMALDFVLRQLSGGARTRLRLLIL